MGLMVLQRQFSMRRYITECYIVSILFNPHVLLRIRVHGHVTYLYSNNLSRPWLLRSL